MLSQHYRLPRCSFLPPITATNCHRATLLNLPHVAGSLWQGMSPVLDAYIKALGGQAPPAVGPGCGVMGAGVAAVHPPVVSAASVPAAGTGMGPVRWWEGGEAEDEAPVSYAQHLASKVPPERQGAAGLMRAVAAEETCRGVLGRTGTTRQCWQSLRHRVGWCPRLRRPSFKCAKYVVGECMSKGRIASDLVEQNAHGRPRESGGGR